ncbi:hypothetical protein CMV30_04625 [Nibricoccus aquaticus]|uniref:Uncharacterized protein n=1 Tax=Nibricoccus aquaticus TaxID=2576891 RepID=A0A290Q3P2_9BACT|nr:hypothetical protein CMV30_04625 [Nibricoccus aquaticus]
MRSSWRDDLRVVRSPNLPRPKNLIAQLRFPLAKSSRRIPPKNFPQKTSRHFERHRPHRVLPHVSYRSFW